MKHTFTQTLMLVCFSGQALVAQQITEGAVTFKDTFIVNWQEYDSLQLRLGLADIDRSDISSEEKAKMKKERIEFHEQLKGKMLEWLKEAEQESVEYVFNKKMAVGKRMQNDKPRDEFLTYEFDSMRMTNRFFLNGKLQKSVIVFSPESTSTNWSDIQESVRIDTSDTKEILGFKCVKYYLRHLHLTKGQQELTVFSYELYVTDAFHLPFFIFAPSFAKDLFWGCPLEIKYITQKMPSSISITRAISFNPTIDPVTFEIPEKFKN